MTGYGFTGPMTDRGTVFDAKEESGGGEPGAPVRRGMQGRGRHRMRGRRLWWLLLFPAWGV